MRARASSLFVLLLIGGIACAADPETPPPSPVWQGRSEAFFWRVETATATSYLLGTSHVGVLPEQLPPPVLEALRGSGDLVVEADLRAPLPQDLLLDIGLLPRAESLDRKLAPEIWAALVDFVSEVVDEIRLKRYRPWLAQFQVERLIIAGLPEMESGLVTIAEASGVEVVGLETPEEQIRFLAQVPEEVSIEDLSEMLSDLEGARASLDRFIRAYEAADFETTRALLLAPEDAVRNELIVYQRNRLWIPPLLRRFDRGGTFVAVGLAHLLGEGSVIELLRAEGLAVSAVPL